MAVEVQSLLFCSVSQLQSTGSRQTLSLLGVFGHHAPGPAEFTIFSSFRGDKGVYELELLFEDNHGDRLWSEKQGFEIENEIDWKYWGAALKGIVLSKGLWTAKLFVDGSIKQLSTFVVAD